MDVIARARELYAQGNHRAAIDLLRPAAEVDSAPYEARLALAEIYRDMGCPDQAGRWGIAIDGWANERERDRLVRLVAASRVEYRWVPAFLGFTSRTDLPRDLVEVRDRVPERHTIRDADAWQPVRESTLADRAGFAALLFWLTAAVLTVLSLVAVYVIAVIGSPGARPIAHISSIATFGAVFGALIAGAVSVRAARLPGVTWRIAVSFVILLVCLFMIGTLHRSLG